MKNIGIKNITIKLKNNQNIIAKPNMFDNLYISHINNSGDEIAFIKDKNNLKANFFMIKLFSNVIEYNLASNTLKENPFNLLKQENSITEVNINFQNGNTQPFTFDNKNQLFVQKNNNDLCVLLSEYDIKYKENLFT